MKNGKVGKRGGARKNAGRKCKICELPNHIVANIDFMHVQGYKKRHIIARYPELKQFYHNLYAHLDKHVITAKLDFEEGVWIKYDRRALNDSETKMKLYYVKIEKNSVVMLKTEEELEQEKYYEQFKYKAVIPQTPKVEKPDTSFIEALKAGRVWANN